MIIRTDLNKCIGCRKCVNYCPMDVFRFDKDAKKSVIAFPETCQSCGLCYINCPTRCLDVTLWDAGSPLTSMR